MKESITDIEPFFIKPLDNGIVLSYFDLSRQIAGDRWFVRLSCEARLPVSADLLEECPPVESEIDAEVRKRIGPTLTFSLVKERNFVAQDLRQATLDDLLTHITENILSYIERPDFPGKLFLREYKKLMQQVAINLQMEKIKADADKDDDGPADFSSCFK